ncbi:MAG: hypothetical protein K6G92_11505 [Bacteroidaceae bacterium]|nr:hypothetical protein [Bacteroidaceae bacterium]
MNTNYIELSDWLNDARREMERDREKLSERIEKIDNSLKAFEVVENLFSKIESQQEELESQKAEIDSLRAQLQEKEVQLSEQRKLTTGMAKKSSEEDLQKALRTYFNTSKRKTIGKRVAVKTVITEFISTMKISLPDDLAEALEHLDDEQPEPSVTVNVAAGGINVQQANTVKK